MRIWIQVYKEDINFEGKYLIYQIYKMLNSLLPEKSTIFQMNTSDIAVQQFQDVKKEMTIN